MQLLWARPTRVYISFGEAAKTLYLRDPLQDVPIRITCELSYFPKTFYLSRRPITMFTRHSPYSRCFHQRGPAEKCQNVTGTSWTFTPRRILPRVIYSEAKIHRASHVRASCCCCCWASAAGVLIRERKRERERRESHTGSSTLLPPPSPRAIIYCHFIATCIYMCACGCVCTSIYIYIYAEDLMILFRSFAWVFLLFQCVKAPVCFAPAGWRELFA